MQLLDEAELPFGGRGGAFGVAQQQDLAATGQHLPQSISCHASALAVVGRHEADRDVRLEAGVDDHRGHTGPLRFLHRAHQGAVVERCEHDPLDALAEKPLHDLYLLLPIVLAERSLPDDAHRRALGRELARRLDRPRVDALPEFVGRSLGDDRDRDVLVGAGAAAARQQGGAQDRGYRGCGESHSVTIPLM